MADIFYTIWYNFYIKMIEEIKINPISKEQIPVLGNFDNFEIQPETKENLRKNKFECLYPI